MDTQDFKLTDAQKQQTEALKSQIISLGYTGLSLRIAIPIILTVPNACLALYIVGERSRKVWINRACMIIRDLGSGHMIVNRTDSYLELRDPNNAKDIRSVNMVGRY